MVACQGGAMAGWALWLDEHGVPHHLYNCFGHHLTTTSGLGPLTPGEHELSVLYVHDGGFGAGGTNILFIDGVEVDRARLEQTVPVIFSMSGETFDVGIDTGSPVGPYRHDYRFTADITSVTLERLSEPDDETRAQMLAGEWTAAMSTQ